MNKQFIMNNLRLAIQRDVTNVYAEQLKDIDVVFTEDDSLFNYKAIGLFEGGHIYMNVCDRLLFDLMGNDAVISVKEIVDNYLIAMAHELGHANDPACRYQLANMAAMVVHKHKPTLGKIQLKLEERAYRIGLRYIPDRLRNRYITYNERYINQLKRNPLFMHNNK